MKSLRNLIVSGLGAALIAGYDYNAEGAEKSDTEKLSRKEMIEQVVNNIKKPVGCEYYFSVNGTNVHAFVPPRGDSSSSITYKIITENDALNENNVSVKVYSDSKVEIECARQKIEDHKLYPYALIFGDKVLEGILKKQREETKERLEKVKKVFGAKY